MSKKIRIPEEDKIKDVHLLPDTDTLASKASESVDCYIAYWTIERQEILDEIRKQNGSAYPRYEEFLKYDRDGNEKRMLYLLSSDPLPFNPHSLDNDVVASDDEIFGEDRHD